MNDNVEYLPIWKKGSTPEEFLLECAMIARKHPERFERFVIVHVEPRPNGIEHTRYVCRGMETRELLGTLAFAQDRVLRDVEKDPEA